MLLLNCVTLMPVANIKISYKNTEKVAGKNLATAIESLLVIKNTSFLMNN